MFCVCVFTVPSACLAISERCTWVMYSKSLAWCQSLWMAERSLSIRKRAEIDTMETKLKSTAFRTATSSLPSIMHYHARFFWIPVILSHNLGGKMILVSIERNPTLLGRPRIVMDCHLHLLVHDCSEISSWIMVYHGPIFPTNHWPTGAPSNSLKIHVFKNACLGVVYHFVHH